MKKDKTKKGDWGPGVTDFALRVTHKLTELEKHQTSMNVALVDLRQRTLFWGARRRPHVDPGRPWVEPGRPGSTSDKWVPFELGNNFKSFFFAFLEGFLKGPTPSNFILRGALF